MTAAERISIDALSLRDRLEQGEPTAVLDVRPTAERADWFIPGSEHVDAYADLQTGHAPGLESWSPPPGHLVVVVCAAGRTSLTAAMQLRARGVDALSLEGGMTGWTGAWNTADVPVPGSGVEIVQVRRTGKGCLSYLAGSNGDAVVVDASVDPAVYERLAQSRGWVIRHVLDTHIHADHLSRGRTLAERLEVPLYLPEQGRATFPHQPLGDGDRLRFGVIDLEALRVPGHTPESSAYLVDSRAIVTGDTLFLQSVGRPDLLGGREEAGAQARALYHSVQRLRGLPGETIVLPAHADAPLAFDGRPFAAHLAAVSHGLEWLELPEEEFVDAVLSRIPPTPANHRLIMRLNEQGLMPGGEPGILEAGANRCAVR